MQTLFRNPLAGPYVLGISSGASLGVALVVLAGVGSSIGIAGAAWVGAAAVLIVITAVGRRIKNIMVILILGMMFSSGVGAVVQILQYFSHEESLKTFVIWTMGSLGDVTLPQLTLLGLSVAVGLLLAVLTIKPLNLLLFGEEYAVTMGLDIRHSRGLLFLLDNAACRNDNRLLWSDRFHRSCYTSCHKNTFPKQRSSCPAARNDSFRSIDTAFLRCHFQNIHLANQHHYRSIGDPDRRMGSITKQIHHRMIEFTIFP